MISLYEIITQALSFVLKCEHSSLTSQASNMTLTPRALFHPRSFGLFHPSAASHALRKTFLRYRHPYLSCVCPSAPLAAPLAAIIPSVPTVSTSLTLLTSLIPWPLVNTYPHPPRATWKDLHRATLQSTLRVLAQYYCAHHTMPRYLAQAQQIVTAILTTPTASSDDSLLSQAVCAVTTRLRVDPFCTTIPGVFNSLCECYHTPVFGVTLDQFKLQVNECLSLP